MTQPTCEERIDNELEKTLETVRRAYLIETDQLEEAEENQYRLIVDCDERGEVGSSVYKIEEDGEDGDEVWHLPASPWEKVVDYDGSQKFDPRDKQCVLEYLVDQNIAPEESTLIGVADDPEMKSFSYEEDGVFSLGLSFDYVPSGTYTDIEEGFFRWQLSWGGPSDEFRFFVSSPSHGYEPNRIEYWFLDWFDGASRTLWGEDKELLRAVFEQFKSLQDLNDLIAESV